MADFDDHHVINQNLQRLINDALAGTGLAYIAARGSKKMTIVVERKPHVEVIERESGWSLKGGRSSSDRTSTKEMIHVDGARCTLCLDAVRFLPEEIEVPITGMLYLNPGEEAGTFLLKTPQKGDFITERELYQVASRLLTAWFGAGDSKSRKIRVILPTQKA